MEFLAILIVWALVHFKGSFDTFQQDGWYRDFIDTWSKFSIPSWAVYCVALFLPLLLIVLVQDWLAPLFWGIPLLLFHVLILLYCIGCGDFVESFGRYRRAWERGDLQASYEVAKSWGNSEASTPPNTSSPEDLHNYAKRELLYYGFQHWFVVIFWFACLGPLGAGLYRAAHSYVKFQSDQDADQVSIQVRVLQLLEWLPARCLGFTFALIGNYSKTLAIWIQNLFEPSDTCYLIESFGMAALDTDVPESVEFGSDEEAVLAEADNELSSLSALLSRSRVFWIVVLAILQIF